MTQGRQGVPFACPSHRECFRNKCRTACRAGRSISPSARAAKPARLRPRELRRSTSACQCKFLPEPRHPPASARRQPGDCQALNQQAPLAGGNAKCIGPRHRHGSVHGKPTCATRAVPRQAPAARTPCQPAQIAISAPKENLGDGIQNPADRILRPGSTRRVGVGLAANQTQAWLREPGCSS